MEKCQLWRHCQSDKKGVTDRWNTVNLKINGMPVAAPEGATILEAAHLAGISIPTLCYLKEINDIGACRICVVEVKGAKRPGRRLRVSR